VSAALLFEFLCTIVRNGMGMPKSDTVRQCSETWRFFTPLVLKINFLCDATFRPSLRGFLFCPEDGRIVCVRNVEFGEVKSEIIEPDSRGFRLLSYVM